MWGEGNLNWCGCPVANTEYKGGVIRGFEIVAGKN